MGLTGPDFDIRFMSPRCYYKTCAINVNSANKPTAVARKGRCVVPVAVPTGIEHDTFVMEPMRPCRVGSITQDTPAQTDLGTQSSATTEHSFHHAWYRNTHRRSGTRHYTVTVSTLKRKARHFRGVELRVWFFPRFHFLFLCLFSFSVLGQMACTLRTFCNALCTRQVFDKTSQALAAATFLQKKRIIFCFIIYTVPTLDYGTATATPFMLLAETFARPVSCNQKHQERKKE
jgi:hypothetical protein